MYTKRHAHRKPNNTSENMTIQYNPKALDTLVRKVVRPLGLTSRQQGQICEWIRECPHVTDIHTPLLANTMNSIYTLMRTHRPPDAAAAAHATEHRQDFIVQKILDYLTVRAPSHTPAPTFRLDECAVFADVGGGNGNVLSGIQTAFRGDANQYLCIETATDWTEEYPHNHTNISYLYWDNQNMKQVADASCHVVLCMVALHHMPPTTKQRALQEMQRILKPGGILLIKEHDAVAKSVPLIYWEHYLYHIFDCVQNGVAFHGASFLQNSVHAFTTKEALQNEMRHVCPEFKFVERTNRFLDGAFYDAEDAKNPTRLYWDIYRKK